MNIRALISALGTEDVVVSGESFAHLSDQDTWLTLNDLTAEQTAAYEAALVDQKAAEVRAERDRRLSASDWTQVSDAPVDQAAWSTYRQALRDIPQQAGFPDNIVWPEVPA